MIELAELAREHVQIVLNAEHSHVLNKLCIYVVASESMCIWIPVQTSAVVALERHKHWYTHAQTTVGEC